MFLCNRIRTLEGRPLISIGIALMMFGALLVVGSLRFIEGHDFLVGFMNGFGAVLMGTSIVFNIRGMQKIWSERK